MLWPWSAPPVPPPPPRPVDEDLARRVDSFVAATRAAVFVRSADNLLLIRPDKTLALNRSAVAILAALYDREQPPAAQVLAELAPRLGTTLDVLERDTGELVAALHALLNDDYSANPKLRRGCFDRSIVQYPTLAEIALTYGCQNACSFCYAASPSARRRPTPMSSEQVMAVMDRIFHQAHVPSLSFTGGEATLRPDLPRLVAHGSRLGFRVNLISNGIRLADERYAASLAEAGLDAAQISIEAGDAELHDRIVGRRGAFAATVAGVRAVRRLGLHVHTNSTLCPDNLDHAHDLVRFVARDLALPTMSMNMVIRAGLASAGEGMEISYRQVAAALPGLLATARAEGVRLVWYSPIPYCIFNPVLHGLGAKSCACVDGILSVDPTGRVLPCSSFEDGIGSLLDDDFATVYASRAARFWKEKRFVPPVCRSCGDVDVCAGGCPLYWDQAGSFGELPRAGADDPAALAAWRRQRRQGASFGIAAPQEGRA